LTIKFYIALTIFFAVICKTGICYNVYPKTEIQNHTAFYSNNEIRDSLSLDTNKKLNKFRVALVASSVPIATTSIFIYMQKAWWKDTMQLLGVPKQKFHFDDTKELKYALCLDKAGHFWSSQVASTVFSDLLQWSGMPYRKASWYGAGFAVITSGIVEIKDGFAPWWGFSLYDMSANILGSFFPVLKAYHPFFKNFNVKWSWDFIHKSYWSSLPHNKGKIFMDDYERHTYWLCTNIKGVAPVRWQKHIPAFLSFDIGLSAENLDGQGAGKREHFIAFGLDLSKITFKKFHFYNSTSHILNFYRLPSPAQKLYPRKVGYLISF